MQQSVPNILSRFADLLGVAITDNRLTIPEKFGTGYCAGFVFNKHMRMLISNYELKEELIVDNPDAHAARRMIFFKFQNIFPKGESSTTHFTDTPSVLIATSRINTDELIFIHSNTATVNIEVDADYLKSLFDLPERSPVLQSLLRNTEPLLFEQLIYPSLQRVADEMLSEQVGKTFELLFLRVKAEELICRLLMELEKRDERHLYPLNNQDIQMIYKVREQMLKHLAKPPAIDQLAVSANMSPTKLKRLFKQVFGDSIFSYYQGHRMKEAVRLLKQENLSVSATGYQLGFTNLSHFSRVFEQHTGMKPKKFSAT